MNTSGKLFHKHVVTVKVLWLSISTCCYCYTKFQVYSNNGFHFTGSGSVIVAFVDIFKAHTWNILFEICSFIVNQMIAVKSFFLLDRFPSGQIPQFEADTKVIS